MRKSKKDREIGAVVSNFGFAFEVFKVIAHAVTAKGGTMEHLRRIVKEPELAQRIAELIVPVVTKTDLPLHGTEYRVWVGYDMPHDIERLQAEFPDGFLMQEEACTEWEWKLHSSCIGMSQVPGERIMCLKQFETRQWRENVAEMDSLGYRPATHEEGYAFRGFVSDQIAPDLDEQLWIPSMGSFTAEGGDLPCVAVLKWDGETLVFIDELIESQYLFDEWVKNNYREPDCEYDSETIIDDSDWPSEIRFLFVRK